MGVFEVLFFFRLRSERARASSRSFFFFVPPLFPLLERVRLDSKWTKNLSLSCSLCSRARAHAKLWRWAAAQGIVARAREEEGKEGRGRASHSTCEESKEFLSLSVRGSLTTFFLSNAAPPLVEARPRSERILLLQGDSHARRRRRLEPLRERQRNASQGRAQWQRQQQEAFCGVGVAH